MSLAFITSNHHKYREVAAIFASRDFELNHIEMEYQELQLDTIEEIALASAVHVAKEISSDFFLEDAGLIIPSLHGFPGPYSSFVYRTVGWQGILRLLEGNVSREAYYQSVFILHRKGEFKQFSGNCHGKIAASGRGQLGFGFDPIFIPDSYEKTFGELGDEVKNQVSHRSISINKLLDFILN